MGPVGRFGSTYAPFSLVTTLRVSPVSVWVTVTVTPGRTAPLSSATRPLSWAVDSCAHETALLRRNNIATSEATRSKRFIDTLQREMG
jgi:hypothetical protein